MNEKGSWLKGKTKEDSNAWKGDSAKYISHHTWIHNNYGKATKCEACKGTGKKKYEWANISGTYIRDISDYMQMCPSCHRKMDFSRTGKCRKGHQMTPENTYNRPDGNKACRRCGIEATMRYIQKKRNNI